MSPRIAQAARFYPGDLAEQLESFVRGWSIPSDIPERLSGGVVPHAGWRFSGRTAARTLHTLIVRMHPECLLFLSSVHVPGVEQASVDPCGSWETPVGPVQIDEDLARAVVAATAGAGAGAIVADPDAHQGDHAIEVQLPLLRMLAPGCRFVPVATPPQADGVAIGTQLGALLRESPRVLVVASTDLTHYGAPYRFQPAGVGPEAARWLHENDGRMVRLVTELEAERIPEEARAQRNSCGPAGLAAAVQCARERGATAGHVIEYTTSHGADPSDRFTTAVGYLGAVFGKQPESRS